VFFAVKIPVFVDKICAHQPFRWTELPHEFHESKDVKKNNRERRKKRENLALLRGNHGGGGEGAGGDSAGKVSFVMR